ncbi:MAG: hypothetical protein J5I47_07755 [Vicingus serpentipes]|nr:hypothetical protein [Vicingus serpentipes]
MAARVTKEGKKNIYQDRANYSEQTIQRVLYKYFENMYYKMSNIYFFGGKPGWESDFFFMTKTKRLCEIEIKVDRQDYDRDFQLKPKKHELFKKIYDDQDAGKNLIPNYYYFCAPEGVIQEESLPDYAGLIEIFGEQKNKLKYTKKAPTLHDNTKDVTDVLLKKLYNKTLSMEKMLSDFRINLFENPEDESEIVRKFLKRIRM